MGFSSDLGVRGGWLVAHKKNSFEEALHRSEEERHEYHIHIEALTRTIAILDPINTRIEGMTNDERASFHLKPDFGGSSRSIYHRTLKKVYGRDAGDEIIQALQDHPVVAVPVVLARLKQKDEEWRRSQREWSRTWREVDVKNFYKSLDHQGISFKANDKKNITAKHFVADIETMKEEQMQARELAAPSFSFAQGSVGHQLEYSFQDTSVLHDSLKMVYSFLDHSQTLYSPQERRSIEKFLRSFIPVLFMCPTAEFNAACGALDGGHDDDGIDVHPISESQHNTGRSSGTPQAFQVTGIPASDLRKQLLKTAQEKSNTKDGDLKSGLGSRASSPAARTVSSSMVDVPTSIFGTTEIFEDVWIREGMAANSTRTTMANAFRPKRRPFFANTTFYTLLRLLQVVRCDVIDMPAKAHLQLLYSRLLLCKQVGEQLAEKKYAPLQANPTAVELGLDDANGPSAILDQVMENLRNQNGNEDVNVAYMYLLDAWDKVYESELDQSTFEEHMRWFFGNKVSLPLVDNFRTLKSLRFLRPTTYSLWTS
jgi:paired amphipathic helix protein Sin3a